MRALAACALAALSACYSPTIEDGQYTCIDDNGCPEGFRCDCKLCIRLSSPSQICFDGPCTASPSNSRAPVDPGLDEIAFCQAAWTLPGVKNPPSCEYVPGQSGNKISDTKVPCSIADNCAPGWHVCNDDAEVAAKGLPSDKCSGMNSTNGFYVTRQAVKLMSNPVSCNDPGDTAVIGCSSPLSSMPSTDCSVLGYALSGCGFNSFNCTPGAVASTLTRGNAMASGGVLCCKD